MGSKTALLLIDVQANMFDPTHAVAGSAALEERLRALLERARGAGAPVILVRNTGGPGEPDEPGLPGWKLQPGFERTDGDLVLDKTTNNTFESTDLASELDARGVTKLVIAGLQSDWCIRATTLGALDLGYRVTLASDGHSTYDGETREAGAITAAVNEELSPRASLVPARDISFSD